ncbi:hypothetical protein [Nocardioides sp. zg-1228]|uniref:hypothetical protein n=1 Tax=Nocardioides sp. zg-1228 TaxID=2763008 RepID=UPI0016430DA5|nr:hypothetical protein [Nocardioides sp. zg-1228]MBC2934433.1 hypothetical protein [Nocardioides sp. zg-1228]QSF59197.1 hypothetical protein JX575_08590 [Nocardioides sp. zg-1228]
MAHVVTVGVIVVLLHAAFRGWAIWSSWFLLDDFNLLDQGSVGSPAWSYLVQTYNGHLMPGGRLIAWAVAQSGHVNWGLAALIMWGLQVLASLSCLWMLIVLFGKRWGVLAPLLLYTTSALSVPSFVWWAASLNQTPIHVSFFCAVACWIHYLRSRQVGWLAGTLLALAFGLFFWVKAILLVPVLAFLALAYFAHGGPVGRLVGVVRTYWLACVVGAVLVASYLAVYLSQGGTEPLDVSPSLFGALAETMLGSAFATGIVGGPWRWNNFAPPTAYADPPLWAQQAAWVLISLVVVYAWLRRTNTLRVWVLVAGYLAALLVLLATSRAPLFGAGIGMELRYVADAILVTTLALGLITMPVVGSLESSALRQAPLLVRPAPRWVAGAVVGVVAIGGIYSSITYAGYWHHENPGKSYLLTLKSDLDRRPPTEMAAQIVPEEVFSSLAAPANNTAFLAPLLSDNATFVDRSSNLATVGPDGSLRQTLIGPGVASRPGPIEDCGWKVRTRGRTIPLVGRAFHYVWWVRIAYLSSDDSPVRIRAGGVEHSSWIMSGLNNLYVRVEGSFDDVRIDGLDPGVTMCVDVVEVGPPEPGGRLP